jgi:hypothetical protein
VAVFAETCAIKIEMKERSLSLGFCVFSDLRISNGTMIVIGTTSEGESTFDYVDFDSPLQTVGWLA